MTKKFSTVNTHQSYIVILQNTVHCMLFLITFFHLYFICMSMWCMCTCVCTDARERHLLFCPFPLCSSKARSLAERGASVLWPGWKPASPRDPLAFAFCGSGVTGAQNIMPGCYTMLGSNWPWCLPNRCLAAEPPLLPLCCPAYDGQHRGLDCPAVGTNE